MHRMEVTALLKDVGVDPAEGLPLKALRDVAVAKVGNTVVWVMLMDFWLSSCLSFCCARAWCKLMTNNTLRSRNNIPFR